MKVIFDIYKNEYTKVFENADYESEVKITKTNGRSNRTDEYTKKISDLVLRLPSQVCFGPNRSMRPL